MLDLAKWRLLKLPFPKGKFESYDIEEPRNQLKQTAAEGRANQSDEFK
jgi:hypothetical protein